MLVIPTQKKAGECNVTVKVITSPVAGAAPLDTRKIKLVVEPAAAAKLTLVKRPDEVACGQATTLSVKLTDRYDNFIADGRQLTLRTEDKQHQLNVGAFVLGADALVSTFTLRGNANSTVALIAEVPHVAPMHFQVKIVPGKAQGLSVQHEPFNLAGRCVIVCQATDCCDNVVDRLPARARLLVSHDYGTHEKIPMQSNNATFDVVIPKHTIVSWPVVVKLRVMDASVEIAARELDIDVEEAPLKLLEVLTDRDCAIDKPLRLQLTAKDVLSDDSTNQGLTVVIDEEECALSQVSRERNRVTYQCEDAEILTRCSIGQKTLRIFCGVHMLHEQQVNIVAGSPVKLAVPSAKECYVVDKIVYLKGHELCCEDCYSNPVAVPAVVQLCVVTNRGRTVLNTTVHQGVLDDVRIDAALAADEQLTFCVFHARGLEDCQVAISPSPEEANRSKLRDDLERLTSLGAKSVAQVSKLNATIEAQKTAAGFVGDLDELGTRIGALSLLAQRQAGIPNTPFVTDLRRIQKQYAVRLLADLGTVETVEEAKALAQCGRLQMMYTENQAQLIKVKQQLTRYHPVLRAMDSQSWDKVTLNSSGLVVFSTPLPARAVGYAVNLINCEPRVRQRQLYRAFGSAIVFRTAEDARAYLYQSKTRATLVSLVGDCIIKDGAEEHWNTFQDLLCFAVQSSQSVQAAAELERLQPLQQEWTKLQTDVNREAVKSRGLQQQIEQIMQQMQKRTAEAGSATDESPGKRGRKH
eukprot:TRINITY_DN3811_c0_g1_i2.p1 TRINITY_DN3811_c0_g1~~TRINITY_DN3811_c0_g1_i2.p1  ORF type:complete len:751 (+),score=198.08 TRINITY_DN3811_c0_g1_i2:2135-4387(+)